MYISKKHYQEAELLLEHLHQKEERLTVQSTALIDDLEKRLSRTEIVHKNIGIGSFKIDLAIYDQEKEQYKCAILTDVMSANVRKDIYHQTNYLKARGWQIFRVFSSEYYKDPNKVVREIRKTLI
jgi:very-short-patch-repair endonuclease